MADKKGHWRQTKNGTTWVQPSTYVEVRCRGCMRRMGVGHGHPMHKLFCSSACADDFPVFENTERDDVIEVLIRTRGWNAPRVALALGVSRQRAQQIISERALTPV